MPTVKGRWNITDEPGARLGLEWQSKSVDQRWNAKKSHSR
jgi:hypothetical protein